MNKQEDDLNNLTNLLEALYKDYLLINRIIYKVKNQFRRQNQFKLLTQLKNTLKRKLFDNSKF
jgi:hypothetical protein